MIANDVLHRAPAHPEALRDFFIAESRRWTKVVESAGIPKQ